MVTNRRLCAAFGLTLIIGALVGGGYGLMRILELVDDAQQDIGE